MSGETQAIDPANEPPATETMEALSGLKVADFSWVGVGPITTRYLADHGATVVRVESSHSPDLLRLSPPFAASMPGINRSAFFANYNAEFNIVFPDTSLDLAGWLIDRHFVERGINPIYALHGSPHPPCSG